MTLENQTIIEVNKNRFKEGARVLEDIARYVFQDLALFQKIKALKQQIKIHTMDYRQYEDIGGPSFHENNQRHNLLELINANVIRMQEAARVLEEFSGSADYKSIRFAAYDIHQLLMAKYHNYTRLEQLSGIYPICDPALGSLGNMADYIRAENIKICQLRMKKSTKNEIYNAAKHFKSLLDEKVLLIINDHVDIALMTADGVHVGQNDLPVKEIRPICMLKLWILSCICDTSPIYLIHDFVHFIIV